MACLSEPVSGPVFFRLRRQWLALRPWLRLRLRLSILASLAALFALGGCSSLAYYAQAGHGQFTLLSQARPIDDWLADPEAPAPLKNKLRDVQRIRRFAVERLDLPNNGSYTRYAQLDRRYVVWNVIATPPLSLKARQWCFPIAGCVNYRGYYDQQAAQDYAAQLAAGGDDVQVSGVPAYSTLGWFDDPVISSFIGYSDAELARLVFHELAHQKVYIKNDSDFNESFATTVEAAGVALWLAQQGDAAQIAAYRVQEARRADFLALLLRYRTLLTTLYASAQPAPDKLRRKAALFDALRADYQVLRQNWGGYAGYDRWFAMPLSNAHLALVATYHDLAPGFDALLRQYPPTDEGLHAFYEKARAIGQLPKAERHAVLRALADPDAPAKP